mgnify:CR=1 FL=1
MSDIDDDSAELDSRENVYSLSLLKLRGQLQFAFVERGKPDQRNNCGMQGECSHR